MEGAVADGDEGGREGDGDEGGAATEGLPMEARDVHPSKASLPTETRPAGRTMEVRAVHSQKAPR